MWNINRNKFPAMDYCKVCKIKENELLKLVHPVPNNPNASLSYE